MRKEYSNTQTTKENIKNTFLKLVSANGYNNVSVNAIIKVIGINRGTFYIHYKTISDVVADIENTVVLRYENYLKSVNADSFDNFVNVVATVVTNERALLTLIISTDCFKNLVLKINEMISNYISGYLKNKIVIDDPEDLGFVVRFVSGGLVSVFRDVLINNKDIDECKNRCAKCADLLKIINK